MSVCLSVRPSVHMAQMDSHRKYGREIFIVDLYQRFGVIKIEKKQDPLYEGLHTSMIILVTKDNKGCAMAQAVSRRLLTVEARVRSGVSTCGIWGGQSGTGTGFPPPEYFGFPLSLSFRRCSITRNN